VRRAIICIISLLAASRLPAQTADTIVVRDSLAAVLPLADTASVPVATAADSSPRPRVEQPPYPVERLIGTTITADITKAGGGIACGFLGGLLAMPMVDTHGDWGGLNILPYALAGAAVGDLAGGSLVIHGMNKRYVDSSPWNAVCGMALHYAAGAGLISLLRTDQKTRETLGWAVYLTAPVSGTAAYLLLGKPKLKPIQRTVSRP
jgi:hypothetical protein